MGFSETFRNVGKSLDAKSVYTGNTDVRRADSGSGADFGSVFLDTVGETGNTVGMVNGAAGVTAGADISRLSAMSQMKGSCFDADFGIFDETEELEDMIGFDEIEELDKIADDTAVNMAAESDNSIFFDPGMLADNDIEEIG